MTDPLGKAEQAIGIAKVLIDTAKESPELNEAGRELAKSALTVTRAINICLLPVAAVTAGYERGKRYFAENFQADLQSKMKDIPEGGIIEPKPSVSAPALEGLAFAHDEPPLKEMYLGLIRSAMNADAASCAHPAFGQVIKQLTATEASLLSTLLGTDSLIALVQLVERREGISTVLRKNHLIDVRNRITDERTQMPELPTYIDNWVRLGLVEAKYDAYMTQETAYEWVKSRPEYVALVQEIGQEKVDAKRGFLRVTDFGKAFGAAVL